MDQVKIGKFISECRKKQKLTQLQLAEKLNITDRAVSKWETGRALPDSSIMLDLCDILKISVNDLLSGEVVTMNEYNHKQEQMLLDMVKEKQEADKRLLKIEIFIVILSCIILFGLIAIAAFVNIEDWIKVVLIVSGFVIFLSACFVALRIEQVAGYYECKKCGHKYVPTYKAVNIAMHMGRTRYLKCPHCGQKSWNKKVISK
jgi:transcriptional regulator with XRE-family HTH domain/DNA-directed RNA polymerase subunit RPC12/RpoP